jgi:uridine kinase
MRSRVKSLLAAALLLTLPGWAHAEPPAAQQAPLDHWLARLHRPFIIGLAGDSGSGKSTFARGLQATLGKDRVKIICVDDYHKLDRQGRKAAGVTALDHAANDLPRLARHLRQLRSGKTIDKPIYDHGDGTLKGPEKFKPAPIVIVEGLHPFATRALREQVDLSIYFDPASSVKKTWKIRRDVGERGHSRAAVLRSIRQRIPDYKRFVQPQREVADVLVQFGWSRRGSEGLQVKLRQRNQRPVARRIRVNASGSGYVLRGERRRDGTGVTTIDGPVPVAATRGLDRLIKRATGVASPDVRRRSEALDAARLLVTSRVMKEIVRAAGRGRAPRGVRRVSLRSRRLTRAGRRQRP